MAPRIPGEDDPTEGFDNENVEDETEEGGEQVGVDDEDESQDAEAEEEDEDVTARGNAPRREAPQRETAVIRAQRLAREARAEADKNARELAELRVELQRSRAPVETPEQEAARLAIMDPEQRAEYRFNKAMENQNRQMAAMQSRLADQADKSAFSAACLSDPLLKTVAAEVETELANIRRQGQNVDREALANYLIGKRARSRAPAAVNKQKKAGERNIARQQGRPSAGRSDREPENRKSDDARRRRLEDVVF